ncbi:DUF4304 domain-containing protein [Microbulbifer thermotolerans]|uniref:DUF4304 domain-containing protein n=1 Tax=Microbulbifer thermotolerans TaxID=252514 RepID=UPI00224A90D9|nr:DUF4304 domain-containing protein [Microbulbifer thermotolerans]MCX2836404.1 DUF4304 domain-containing protein [Microbulbifer thermotolerans]
MSKRESENLRAILVQDVGDRLANVFVKKGFSLVPLPAEEAKSELKIAFPLGRLKRMRDDNLDVIEFQFDKYGRPKFVINFGIVPPGGVTLPWGDHLDQNVADVSAISESYRLYSSSLRARWFELGLLSPKNEQAITSLVDKAIVLSNEITNWFECKNVGKHMKRFGLPV